MVSMGSLFMIWLLVLAVTFPALPLLGDRITNWSDYDSFFVAIIESRWKATKIFLYNTYLIAGTVIFVMAVIPALVLFGILSIFGAAGDMVA